MRQRVLTYLILVVTALFLSEQANAQYYSWGADPARFKWNSASTDGVKIIYPRHAEQVGLSTLYFANRLKPYISYGFKLPPLEMPFVVHPENMRSNGLVMWLPKRIEILSSPAINSYSMPWIKQLAAHEYRHAAQYNNLNVGFVKFLSYLLGQQSSTIGLVYMPLWMMEGDATMFETEASTFGRGKQPRFTLEFRAMGDIAGKYRNMDKFFCGSYRDFIPDHYQLGYQMVAHGNYLSGRIMANDMASYGPRHPWTIISENWRMKHLFGFSTHTLFESTFNALTDHWNSLPRIDNSSSMLPTPRTTSYTTYNHPIWIDSNQVLLLKESLNEPSQFVMLDPSSGIEQRLSYTGSIATRPAYDASSGRVYWTEYRRSTMFQQKVTSTLCYMDLDKLRPRTIKSRRQNILYPTPDGKGGLAWVQYAPQGIYSLHYRDNQGVERSSSLPFGQEIHSLAWDNQSERFYCIITGDEGMWIARSKERGDVRGALEPITRPAYITLSDLRAADGKLYFGSIASGRDEVHYIDLESGREYQLSESTYGSFSPAAAADDMVLMTTYDSMGYHPAVQRREKFIREVEYSPVPSDILLPKRESWGIINLDTISLAAVDTTQLNLPRKERRYRKGLHQFNFHSWAPISFDPFGLSEEGTIAMNAGATLMTQNLLSSLQGFFTYGYGRKEGHIFRTSLRYYGLGPTISFNASYGGSQNIYPIYVYNPEKHTIEFPVAPTRGKYYSVGLDVSFPLMFQRGYHTRHLILAMQGNYSNGLVANTGRLKFDDSISNVATIGYSEGLYLTSLAIGFQDLVSLSHRDFAPPWGVVASANYAINPANGSFSDLVALYTKIYTPGLFAHNSFNVALAYQTSIGGFKSSDALSALTFKSSNLLLRGFDSSQIENNDYMAASLNYQFPICYPDGGIRGIVYLKRMRINLGFDIAQFQRSVIDRSTTGGIHYKWHRLNSWGGDLIFDLNILSQPASATTALKLSFYQPSEGGFFVAAGVELPF